MIGFRQCDPRFPHLWEGSSQPAGRWHAEGEGPAHYFADTPDGAWAEFLRHEEITDPADLATIRRAIWAVDLGDAPVARPDVSPNIVESSTPASTYDLCQAAARAARAAGHQRLDVPSLALQPGGARGRRVEDGGETPPRDGRVFVLFGDPRELKLQGWPAAAAGTPSPDLLPRVRHYKSAEAKPAEDKTAEAKAAEAKAFEANTAEDKATQAEDKAAQAKAAHAASAAAAPAQTTHS